MWRYLSAECCYKSHRLYAAGGGGLVVGWEWVFHSPSILVLLGPCRKTDLTGHKQRWEEEKQKNDYYFVQSVILMDNKRNLIQPPMSNHAEMIKRFLWQINCWKIGSQMIFFLSPSNPTFLGGPYLSNHFNYIA